MKSLTIAAKHQTLAIQTWYQRTSQLLKAIEKILQVQLPKQNSQAWVDDVSIICMKVHSVFGKNIDKGTCHHEVQMRHFKMRRYQIINQGTFETLKKNRTEHQKYN